MRFDDGQDVPTVVFKTGQQIRNLQPDFDDDEKSDRRLWQIPANTITIDPLARLDYSRKDPLALWRQALLCRWVLCLLSIAPGTVSS